MGKCTQTYETQINDFLKPEDTKEIADSCSNGALTEIKSNIYDNLSERKTPGFSKEALYINGYSPIAEIVNDIKKEMDKDITTVSGLHRQIMNEGIIHTKKEVEEFHNAVADEYSKRRDKLTAALDYYNHEVDSHNQQAAAHNAEENNKEQDDEKNLTETWDVIYLKETGEAVEEFKKEELDKRPNEDVPGAAEVEAAEKEYTQAFDEYVVKVYDKVKAWKDLPTEAAPSATESAITIDETYQTFSKEKYNENDYREYPNDHTKVVTVKKDDGSVEYYRYNEENRLIELHVVDANKENHYYTSTGVPATKVDANNPQSPVIPTSVINGVEEKDITTYDDAIVVHRREGEGENTKDIYYTYDKDGIIKSIKDGNKIDVTGQALCYENSNYNTKDAYEIKDEYKQTSVSTQPTVGFEEKTYQNDDGSKSTYRYRPDGTLSEVHVVDENGNNYYYTDKGQPASKVTSSDLSSVIPNAVLDGGDVTRYDMATVVCRVENGKRVYYTYQDGYGLRSVNDGDEHPVTGEVDNIPKK